MARQWQQRRNGLGAGHELGTKRAAETLWLQEFRVGIAATWRPAKTPAGGSVCVAGKRKHRHRWRPSVHRARGQSPAYFGPRKRRRKLVGRTKMNHLPSHVVTSKTRSRIHGMKSNPVKGKSALRAARRLPLLRAT